MLLSAARRRVLSAIIRALVPSVFLVMPVIAPVGGRGSEHLLQRAVPRGGNGLASAAGAGDVHEDVLWEMAQKGRIPLRLLEQSPCAIHRPRTVRGHICAEVADGIRENR